MARDVWRASARVEGSSSGDEHFCLVRDGEVAPLGEALGALDDLAVAVSESAAGRVLRDLTLSADVTDSVAPPRTDTLHVRFAALDARGASAALGTVAEMAERVYSGRGAGEKTAGPPANLWTAWGRPRGTWPRASDTGWWSLACWFAGVPEGDSRARSIRWEREGDDLGGALGALVAASKEAGGVRWVTESSYSFFDVRADLRRYPPNPSGSAHVRFSPRDRLLVICRRVAGLQSALVALEAIGDAAELVYGDDA